MNWLINFVSWLVGVVFLITGFILLLVLDVSDANVTIVLIALAGFSLLIIPPTKRWFSEKIGMNPHRGILVLFYLLAFGYAASTLQVASLDAESAYEQVLLDELKILPTANYSENLVRYEALVELRPYKKNYKDKVAFYIAKIEEASGQPYVAKLRPSLPKKDKQPLGVISYLFLFVFGWVFVKAVLHKSNPHIKDKVVQDVAEFNLRDDEPAEADIEADIEVKVVTDKKPDHEQEVDNFALPKEFIVFDLETTGLSPYDCEIIEIGAIKVNRDFGEHIAFQALVKPSIALPSKIIHLTSITQKMINKNGEDIKTVIPEFLDFIGDLRLVAYNARFDMGFIHVAVAK